MSEQDLIGFDDGPVPQEVVNGKLPLNGNAVDITKTEMVLNNLNAEKSLKNGKHEETQIENVNGSHETEVDYDDTPANGHLNGNAVKDANGVQAENGEHVYSEVPEKEIGEDNIYEEVMPVAARKNKESTAVKHDDANENGSPLYDDSSLSSELSADLSPPPSNTEDATGAVMSDPECDAVMAAEISQEEAASATATDNEPRNDGEPTYEDASSVADATSVNGMPFVAPVVNEELGYAEVPASISTPDVVPATSESVEDGQSEGPCYANVDVFVDCVETTDADETSEEQSSDFHQPHVTDETVKAVTHTEVMLTPEIEAVKKEHPQLRTRSTETIIDKEIRAQKEREEMIAQERKLAQEIMKRSTSVEKEVTSPTSTPKMPVTTTRQTSLNSAPSTPAVSSPAPFPAPVEKRYNCPSDSRIADEIRELKEREEELKELRERLQAEGELVAKNGMQKSNNADASEMTNGSSTPSSTTGLSRTMSVESVQSGQASLSFGSRRKDRITVRPLSDETESLSPTVFSPSNGESPIEREIRMAKDREEALRREKLLLGQLQAEGFVKKTETTPVAAKPVNNAVRSPVRGSAQKLLATSRIQQEIEEQTQREMDLRASGHIQTISQERTDSKVTGIGNVLVTGRSEEAKTPPQQPQPAFLANDTSIPNVEIYEKTPPATKPATPVSNGKCAGGVTPVTNKNGNPPRAVSMQKFIASRGKELVFTQQHNGSCGSEIGPGLGYCELKPPQVRRGSGVDRKGFVTAETKIQEEMRAMKEREEELKRQRTRLIGQPQPNLSSNEYGKPSSPDQMTSSVENLWAQEQVSDRTDGAEDAQLLSGSDGNNSGCARRRSALIAQWEQRIQKTDTVKS
ncbi:uncharacterized protein LOC135391314 isoform X2 [Ornithodoros turicata]